MLAKVSIVEKGGTPLPALTDRNLKLFTVKGIFDPQNNIFGPIFNGILLNGQLLETLRNKRLTDGCSTMLLKVAFCPFHNEIKHTKRKSCTNLFNIFKISYMDNGLQKKLILKHA